MIDIVLPVGGDATLALRDVRDKLTKTFGGVTMNVNSPAEGVWENDGDRDRIVVFEVMTSDLDRNRWATYRKELEARLNQGAIVLRASEVQRL